MQPQDTKQWTDLDGIVASTTPLIPEVNRCSITRGSNETIDILLLPQGMFSLFVDPLAPMLCDELSNPLLLALGRVLVDYAVAQGKHDPATDDELQCLDSPAIEATPIYWRDLPDVTAVVGRGPERMIVTAFRSGSQVLGLFIRDVSCRRVPIIGMGAETQPQCQTGQVSRPPTAAICPFALPALVAPCFALASHRPTHVAAL